LYNLFVHDLLLDDYKVWNIAKIRTIFSGPTANLIINTPLIASVHEDTLAWNEERNGCYFVKSEYNLVMCHILCDLKFHLEGNWNNIWNAQAPHRAQHWLWRLCRLSGLSPDVNPIISMSCGLWCISRVLPHIMFTMGWNEDRATMGWIAMLFLAFCITKM
jgi:hypothetical protein